MTGESIDTTAGEVNQPVVVDREVKQAMANQPTPSSSSISSTPFDVPEQPPQEKKEDVPEEVSQDEEEDDDDGFSPTVTLPTASFGTPEQPGHLPEKEEDDLSQSYYQQPTSSTRSSSDGILDPATCSSDVPEKVLQGKEDDDVSPTVTLAAGTFDAPEQPQPLEEDDLSESNCEGAEDEEENELSQSHCEESTSSSDNKILETKSFGSENQSNCGSSRTGVTARTRLETMDSTLAVDVDDIDRQSGRSIEDDHPRRSNKKGSAALISTESSASADNRPPSKLWQHAQCVHRQWVRVTKQVRGVMLRAIIAVSVTAARHPRVTLIGVALFSFAMIIAGYFTNFTVRLDNDKVFTPIHSELIEYAEFMSNTSLYEGVEFDNQARRQRRLGQGAAGGTLRSLDVKITVFHEDHEDTNSTTVEYILDPVNETGLEATQAPTQAPTSAPLDFPKGQGLAYPFMVHADHENIFTIEGIERVFDVIDHVKTIPGWVEHCSQEKGFRDFATGAYICEIRAITRFWDNNRTLFHEKVKTNQDLFNAVDGIFYPDGGYVDLPFVLAKMEEDENGRPVAGQAFAGIFFLKSDSMQHPLAEYFRDLRADWVEDKSNIYVLEFASPSSIVDEVKSAIMGDLPLLPVVFVMMCAFTCLVFFKWHRVYSRSLLGLGAVFTIFMSIMSGYGLMFICGVPITMMTNLIIFVIFGVGLDDTFIITGAYFRTGHDSDPIKRIEQTMESVGSSILLTTLTTIAAFCTGCMSTILPIRWVCIYGFSTILIDFIYQITFFTALLVLDERRIQENRMDCCICIRVPKDEQRGPDNTGNEAHTCMQTPTSFDHGQQEESKRSDFEGEGSVSFHQLEKEVENLHLANHYQHHQHYDEHMSDHVADQFMRWFAERLMHPVVKILVVIAFTAFAALCAYQTTLLRQKFNFKDLLPKGSHVASFVEAVEYYSERTMALKVEFRFVDQSDPDIRDQMEQYVQDLVENVDALSEEPPLFWVREFKNYIKSDETMRDLPFYEQLSILLSQTAIRDAFGGDLVRRGDGTIISSVCKIYVTDINFDVVQDQINFLKQVRKVTKNQPINQGKKLSCFFAYDSLLHIFSFYEVAVEELTSTTVSSVIAVCVIAFLCIPHWSALPIIAPMVSVLYIDMMGVLQMFGYSINIITYIILVISIGLLVDFIMHILLRYYESEFDTREEKVKDALGTMGSSVLVGGLSTFLGVTPLIFSTSEVLSTVCVAFLAMVALGITHGLILLPVLLSYFGTERVVRHRKRLSLLKITANISQQLSIRSNNIAKEAC